MWVTFLLKNSYDVKNLYFSENTAISYIIDDENISMYILVQCTGPAMFMDIKYSCVNDAVTPLVEPMSLSCF